jgi:hypothetical protein
VAPQMTCVLRRLAGAPAGRASSGHSEALRNGVKTEADRICAKISHFFVPNFQLRGELRHEFVGGSGQKQEWRALTRAVSVVIRTRRPARE